MGNLGEFIGLGLCFFFHLRSQFQLFFIKLNQNFIITLNFNMDTQTNSFVTITKEPSQKLADDQPRGFKPVISIPIVHSPSHSYEKQSALIRDSDLPPDKKANAMYQEYLKLIKQNKLIKTTIDHVNREKTELIQKINSLQSSEKDEGENRKKRHRRSANQIVRAFQCPQENCDKSYGAEASLAQHIKLKHGSYFGTSQYQKFMQEIIKKNKQESVQ